MSKLHFFMEIWRKRYTCNNQRGLRKRAIKDGLQIDKELVWFETSSSTVVQEV